MNTRRYTGEELLRDRTVFLSASKPSRDYDLFPPGDEAELEECVRCLARAVFAEGGRLVFGAHPSISPLIVDVATEYFPSRWDHPNYSPPVTMYQSEAFRDVIPAATRELERLGYARTVVTEPQAGEHYDPMPPLREQCLQSLAHMRRRMFEETKPDAMVAIGGMQGVLREARLFLEMLPGTVYVSNSLGGAAASLIPYLAGNILREPRPIYTIEWQRRVVAIEPAFENAAWESIRRSKTNLPPHPYALLMQRVVRHIGGENV